MSSTEAEKRKRRDDGETNGKPREDNGAVKRAAPPPDEEVEEFFAIVKRIRVAVKYFQRRDGATPPPAKPTWNPAFQREDFDGVKTEETEGSQRHEKTGLDLNSDPVSDDSV